MVTSFTGYADDIFHVTSNFHIQKPTFGRKASKFGGKSKHSWTPRVSFRLIFATSGTLGTCWRHQVPSGVVVRNVEGKSRAKALLNTV